MPTANDVIAHSLSTAQGMLHRFVDDLKPEEFLHRTTDKANCTAWLIGHLTLTYRKAAASFGVMPAELPPLPEGYEKQFSREEGCPQAQQFGDVTRLMPLFDAHSRLLIEAVKRLPAERLDTPSERQHPLFKTAGEFANFMAMHVMLHVGQITLIRRSLGRPPVV
jgi:hypothetical protein